MIDNNDNLIDCCDDNNIDNSKGDNAIIPDKYLLGLDWGDGKSVNLEVLPNCKPEEMAFNFCKKYNMDYASMEMITNQIKDLLSNTTNVQDNKTNTCNKPMTPIMTPDKDNNNIDDHKEKKQIGNKAKYVNHKVICFNPYDYLFLRKDIDSQRTQYKKHTHTQTLNSPLSITTAATSTTTATRRNKTKDKTHLKSKKIIRPFTMKQNEKRLKMFLTIDDQFTEQLYHCEDIIQNHNCSKDMNEDIRYTLKKVGMIHNDTYTKMKTYSNYNNVITPLTTNGLPMNREIRTYANLNIKGKAK